MMMVMIIDVVMDIDVVMVIVGHEGVPADSLKLSKCGLRVRVLI